MKPKKERQLSTVNEIYNIHSTADEVVVDLGGSELVAVQALNYHTANRYL
jgi:hypothetical protein